MRLLIAALAVAAAFSGIALGLRLYLGRPAEDRLRAGEDVAIAQLRAPLPGNGFLVCPAGHCAVPEAPAAPVFAMPPARLQQCWRRLFAAEPRVVEVAADQAGCRILYIQHTPLLRFPDLVTVEFVALPGEHSSVAIYSRARYGRADFATNRRRVEAWLARLAAAAPAGRC